MMKKRISRLFVALLLMMPCLKLPGVSAADRIRIVTTTTTFGSIAKAVAGELAEIYSVASPNRNIHFISPTPRDVLKVKKADVFIHGGLDLEAWRAPLLDAAGRPELMWPAGARQIDVSRDIPLLETPVSLSRIEGDIHAYGNPHYWSDPENGKIIAENIAEGLAAIYPDKAAVFRENLARFTADIDGHMKTWQAALKPYEGTPVVSYHRSLIYFMKRFGLKSAGELEPKPGIPPTARHLAALEKTIRERNVPVILQEPYYEKKTAESVAAATGAEVVLFVQDVGAVKDASNYIDMVGRNVRSVARGLDETRGEK